MFQQHFLKDLCAKSSIMTSSWPIQQEYDSYGLWLDFKNMCIYVCNSFITLTTACIVTIDQIIMDFKNKITSKSLIELRAIALSWTFCNTTYS